MYFESKIRLTPKNDIELAKKVPTKVFGKFLHAITMGTSTKEEQRMTKNAVTILQLLNIAFMKRNITNIIQLAKDGYNFYLDESGKDNDLEDAMAHFKLNKDILSPDLFSTLFLVLEHEDEHLKYLIEIDINRVTQPRVNPITITVNGLVKDFSAKGDESLTKDKMRSIFEKADDYNTFIDSHKTLFTAFVDGLTAEIKNILPCDEMLSNSKTNILSSRGSTPSKGLRSRANPLYSRGYYGYDDDSLYIWLWMDMLMDNDTHFYDTNIVDDAGREVQQIGSEGVYGSTCSAFNDTIECEKDTESESTIDDNVSASDNSSWLSGSSDDSYSDSSASSCSSGSNCSSCGGD